MLVLLGEDGAPFFNSNRPVAFKVSGKIWVNTLVCADLKRLVNRHRVNPKHWVVIRQKGPE